MAGNDLTALKIAEFLFYCKGQKYESRRFLRLTTQCLSRLRDNPYFRSIHSFALELCGNFEESWQFANAALSNNKDNPWPQHTLAHLYLNTGQIEEGIAFLERYAPSWKNSHPIIKSHLLWHLALLYLENLNFDKAAEIYQRADWLHQTTFVSRTDRCHCPPAAHGHGRAFLSSFMGRASQGYRQPGKFWSDPLHQRTTPLCIKERGTN